MQAKSYKQDESSITDVEEDRRLSTNQQPMQQTAGTITNIINNNNINNFIIGDPTKVPPAVIKAGNFIDVSQKQGRVQSAEHMFKEHKVEMTSQ